MSALYGYNAKIRLKKDADLDKLGEIIEDTFLRDLDWCLEEYPNGTYIEDKDETYDVDDTELLKITPFCEDGFVEFADENCFHNGEIWLCYLDNGVWKKAEGKITYNKRKAVEL